jgi:hypothetical protein
MVYIVDFVDALSAPIQFMSQAEKRAKQLQGLGIDEKDISDVSVSLRRKQEPAVDTAATASTAASKHTVQQATSTTAIPSVAAEQKGETMFYIDSC